MTGPGRDLPVFVHHRTGIERLGASSLAFRYAQMSGGYQGDAVPGGPGGGKEGG